MNDIDPDLQVLMTLHYCAQSPEACGRETANRIKTTSHQIGPKQIISFNVHVVFYLLQCQTRLDIYNNNMGLQCYTIVNPTETGGGGV